MRRLPAAVGFPNNPVYLEDLPPSIEGLTGGGLATDNPPRFNAFVNRALPDPSAEATALHEAAHWHLGHEDPSSGYEGLRAAAP